MKFDINKPKVKNIIGKKYGKLTVIEQHGFTEPNKHGSRYAIWYCKCDCGNYIERTTDVLKRGKSSCGCNQKETLEKMAKNNITHNMTHTRLYRIYKGMIGRCYYPCTDRYNVYGGRGITVCDEWKNDRIKFFEWALNNGYEENLTIERIDVDGNYEPNNCKWITMKEQYKNKQSNKKLPLPFKKETRVCLKCKNCQDNVYRHCLNCGYDFNEEVEDENRNNIW